MVFCWILDESRDVFSIDIDDNQIVYHLKHAIVKEHRLVNVVVPLLELWKVLVSKNNDIDHEKLRNIRGNEQPLRSWTKASDIFSPPHLLENSIVELIVVELPFSGQPPAGLISPVQAESRLYNVRSPPAEPVITLYYYILGDRGVAAIQISATMTIFNLMQAIKDQRSRLAKADIIDFKIYKLSEPLPFTSSEPLPSTLADCKKVERLDDRVALSAYFPNHSETMQLEIIVDVPPDPTIVYPRGLKDPDKLHDQLIQFHTKFWGKDMEQSGLGHGDDQMDVDRSEEEALDDDLIDGCHFLDIDIENFRYPKIWIRAEYIRIYDAVKTHYEKGSVLGTLTEERGKCLTTLAQLLDYISITWWMV